MEDLQGIAVFFVLQIPWPWPRSQPISVRQSVGNDRYLTMASDNDGRLSVSIYSETSNLVFRNETCKIKFVSEGMAIVSLAWSADEEPYLNINEIVIGFDRDDEVCIHGKKRPPLNDSAGIEDALRRRRDIRRELKSRGPIQETQARRVADLRTQLSELDALLHLQISGTSMISSIACKLRILVGTGDGNGLIQDVAALAGLPLNVYGIGDSDMEYSLAPDVAIKSWSMSLVPTYACTLTDLDAWLKWDVLRFGGKIISNQKLIQTIADKIGAHVDRREDEMLVRFLVNSDQNRNGLVNYVTTGAVRIIELGAALIHRVETI